MKDDKVDLGFSFVIGIFVGVLIGILFIEYFVTPVLDLIDAKILELWHR